MFSPFADDTVFDFFGVIVALKDIAHFDMAHFDRARFLGHTSV